MREGGACGAVQVRLTTSGVTATEGIDFVRLDTIVRWEAGDTGAKTVAITLLEDNQIELFPQWVKLSLSEPQRASIDGPLALLSIRDNDLRLRRREPGR